MIFVKDLYTATSTENALLDIGVYESEKVFKHVSRSFRYFREFRVFQVFHFVFLLLLLLL